MKFATGPCHADVLIVGAGPAGLASAIAAARHGLRVQVIDAMKPPIDKACGEGLMPDSLEALAANGSTNVSTLASRIVLPQYDTTAPWTDLVEVYWSNVGQPYCTPKSSNQLCVAFIPNKKFATPQQAPTHFPALRHHLAAAQPNGPA